MKEQEKEYEQLSFDINLPKNDIETITEILDKKPDKKDAHKEQEPLLINPARVPDEEYQKARGETPMVNDILKVMNKGVYKIGTHELLSDVFQCGAIAISNRFDKRHAEEREKIYLQIMQKYDKESRLLISELFSMIYGVLSRQIFTNVGFNDYLGELYMKSETSNSKAGQFFTPFHLSRLCAEMTIDEGIIKKHMSQDKILTLNEPSCGSSGMILAAADILYNRYKFNISRNLLVICSDIDSRCVHMSYLQLGLAGIPAIIYHQDTLSMNTWDVWETPAYIMQYMRFRNVLKK